ncbi:unnamed protein product [Zymoseptoria tritici ST99CH_1A5]|uniref:Integrase catalytic domain-containing protein n=1 Tax=Zymoseptoria tritici ST99CH_1A5 TaxID=1276529 RepID=A0A1Y6M0F9_ZYMTR|nr:unnamed protein product [Zymoseptoria tritici ST99CH_3D1]SMY30062.1 unnamed protein product [Zymoseptoria tritici ST99CH_1A5]
MVVVDRITKMRHFIPMVNCGDQEELDAHHIAYAFLDHAWKLHALPSTITSDRGPQFVSSFWRSLCNRLKTHMLFGLLREFASRVYAAISGCLMLTATSSTARGAGT